MRGPERRTIRAGAVIIAWAAAIIGLHACGERGDGAREAGQAPQVDPAFAAVADSDWVTVNGPTLIAFHPLATNEQLEADQDLATVLDDFAYHIGSAMDSLTAAGIQVEYHAGDTVWVRARTERWRFVRPADSPFVGYLFIDGAARRDTAYGVLGSDELITFAAAVKAGTPNPLPDRR